MEMLISKHRIYRLRTLSAVGIMLVLLLTGCSKSDDKTLSAFQSGNDALEAMDYAGALTFYETALAEEKDLVAVYRAQGLAYMGMIEYEKALEAFQLALGEGSSTPKKIDYDINYYIAVCDYKLGRFADARDRYDAILALKPKEQDALYLRGVMQLALNAYDAAITDFDTALSYAPKDYGLYIDVYSALAEYGYRDAGVVYLETAMNSDNDDMSDYDRGRIYYYLGNYEYARNYLEKSRSAEAGKAEVSLMLGQAYEALNDCNYAIVVYDGFLAEKEDAEVYNQLGLCKMRLADYEGALKAFQDGLALEDKKCRQTLKFNEIVAYEKLTRFDTAEQLLTEYLKTYPDDETAKRENEFLKTR